MLKLLHLFFAFAQDHGVLHDCFLVGGAVRDILLGRDFSDCDIVVCHDAEHIAQAFCSSINGRFIMLDPVFGMMRITYAGQYIDICRMQGNALHDDLRKRDLTINAMALPLVALYEPNPHEKIIDPCNGKDDIFHKRIRMVSAENFINDPLRMLRAYRFTLQLRFSLDPQTSETIRMHAHLLTYAAVERIISELRIILASTSSYPLVKLLYRDHLLEQILPEIQSVSKIGMQKQMQSFGYLEHMLNNIHLYFFDHAHAINTYFHNASKRVALKLAVLLPSIEAALIRARQLHCSRKEIDSITMLARYADHFSDAMGADKADRIFLLHRIGSHLYTLVLYQICQECICQFTDSLTVYYCREMLDLYHGEYQKRARLIPLLSGDELMHTLEIPASPFIGHILSELERLTLNGSISTKDEAINTARHMLTMRTL